MNSFIKENAADLEAFSRMSQCAGARNDYVQGGGGNTSAKLAGGLMGIKASGYCLSDITPETAYAVLDYEALRRFYYGNESEQLADVEKQGSAFARENTKQIEGLPTLRPSVEAGFHSILRKFVCHTHSVYANFACCSTACREIAEKAFAGADYSWGWVPYTDPGANLTFAIRRELARVEHATGRVPAVILMQNHGIIVHSDSADECLRINEVDAPALTEALQSGRYDYRTLIESPLYPDQMVFLIGTLFENKPELAEGEASVEFRTGRVLLRMKEKNAQVVAETLTAVTFIMDTIRENGYTVSTMGEAAKRFIANWESEKYRKSLAEKA